MILYPAIDILRGRAVRLVRGDFATEIDYDADPVDAARRWAKAGARFLHVVDLDGARSGYPVNVDAARRIARAVDVPVQLGGGLREPESVKEALAAGVERAVLGTKAQQDPGLVATLVSEHGERVVASVDARRGRVAVSGWEEGTTAAPAELVALLTGRGVKRFIYTPVDVDGTMEGPDVASLHAVAAATEAEVLYSGGIGSLEDLHALARLKIPNLAGVIVGRALYEGRFGIAEAQRVLERHSG